MSSSGYNFYIEGNYVDAMDIKISIKRNQSSRLECNIYNPESAIISLLVENSRVLCKDSLGNSIFGGYIKDSLDSDNDNVYEIVAFDGSKMLMDRIQENKTSYSGINPSTIVTDINDSILTLGTINSGEVITIDLQNITKLENIARITDICGYYWYVTFTTSGGNVPTNFTLNFTESKGSVIADTLVLNSNIFNSKSGKSEVANSVVALGKETAGIKIKSKQYFATNVYTYLTSDLASYDSVVYVNDTVNFPNSGTLRIGIEEMTFTKTGGTTFSVSRSVPYSHSNGIYVFDGQYTPSSPQFGSSIAEFGILETFIEDTDITLQDSLDALSLNTLLSSYTQNDYMKFERLISVDQYVIGDTLTIWDEDEVSSIEQEVKSVLYMSEFDIVMYEVGYLPDQFHQIRIRKEVN